MAVRPLRPATDHGLGGPLPRQLANRPRPPPQANCSFDPQYFVSRTLCGISPGFPGLFPTRGQVSHVLLTRSPLYSRSCPRFLVRLACVRHAASVDSEPGSNSRLKSAHAQGTEALCANTLSSPALVAPLEERRSHRSSTAATAGRRGTRPIPCRGNRARRSACVAFESRRAKKEPCATKTHN